jgi:hypothetical protein
LGHGAHAEPPQSTSVSVPFFTPSLHPGCVQRPLEQYALVQSLPPMHFFPFAHAGHVPPPQSLSVSAPFSTPSLQLAA